MITTIWLPVLAGLAVFLFGMKLMELALHHWAGPYLHLWIERFTKTPMRGLLIGGVLSAILQSSTAITVITIGLVNAGLISFSRTLGIILGTNIGTCLTTELIGLSIGKLGLPLLAVGSSVWFMSWLAGPLHAASSSWLRSSRYGSLAVSGFSLVLLGIEMMKSIGPELQTRGLFAWFVEQSQHSLLWGVIAGAAVTALVHSSSAVIAMAMGLASIDAISVDLGVAITLGANAGTCVTALMASIGGTKAGRFVAWSHILLNVGGILLFYPFIQQLVAISSSFAGDQASQVARSQTLFNVLSSLLALPLCYLSMWKNLERRS